MYLRLNVLTTIKNNCWTNEQIKALFLNLTIAYFSYKLEKSLGYCIVK